MRRNAKVWGGTAVSVIFMVALFRKMDFRQLGEALREIEPVYVAAGVAVMFASYFLRGVRWWFILLPLRKLPFRPVVSTTLVGYMANNVLPARLGEFVRAYALAETEGMRVSSVFGTLVLDRLWDGMSLLTMLLLTLFTVTLPPGMEKVQAALVKGGYVTMGIYAVAVLFLLFLKKRTEMTLRLVAAMLAPFPGLRDRVLSLLRSFLDGLTMSASPAVLAGIVGSSVAIWFASILSLNLLIRSFGIELPLSGAMLIMVFLVFAVMVPASPGFIGTYHFACVQGLKAFQVPEGKALSMALVIHAANFFPTVAAGFVALWTEKLSLKSLADRGDGGEGP